MSLIEKTAAELLALQAAGQASAAEIADAFLTAVADREPKLKSFMTVDDADVRLLGSDVDSLWAAYQATL